MGGPTLLESLLIFGRAHPACKPYYYLGGPTLKKINLNATIK